MFPDDKSNAHIMVALDTRLGSCLAAIDFTVSNLVDEGGYTKQAFTKRASVENIKYSGTVIASTVTS